jgi:hypothetical protein
LIGTRRLQRAKSGAQASRRPMASSQWLQRVPRGVMRQAITPARCGWL